MSIASSRSIRPWDKAVCMLFSSSCFCSSSGSNSINIPKSYKYNSDISLRVATLWAPMACTNASAVGEYSNISDILRDNASATSVVKNIAPSWICLVATLEFAAANFWTPTSALGSGVLPSRDSFKPVTSLIIWR